MQLGTVLADEFGGHLQALSAKVAIRGQRGKLALRERQFEGIYRGIGHVREGRGGYPRFGDERISGQVNGYPLTLENQDQLWERFIAMADEIRGAFQRSTENWSDGLRMTHD